MQQKIKTEKIKDAQKNFMDELLESTRIHNQIQYKLNNYIKEGRYSHFFKQYAEYVEYQKTVSPDIYKNESSIRKDKILFVISFLANSEKETYEDMEKHIQFFENSNFIGKENLLLCVYFLTDKNNNYNQLFFQKDIFVESDYYDKFHDYFKSDINRHILHDPIRVQTRSELYRQDKIDFFVKQEIYQLRNKIHESLGLIPKIEESSSNNKLKL